VTSDEPASPIGDGGLADDVRVRLDLAYDGTDFAGWGRQPGLRTVQQVVEDGLAVVLRRPERVRLTVAGRTDAGVHARGQVAHADVPTSAWTALPDPGRALTGVLPPDVRLRGIGVAPVGFDARFSALSRLYAYRICDDPLGPDPLRRKEVLWHRQHRLDLDRLRAASAPLLGLRDFAAFCRHREGGTTVRTLLRLDWDREVDGTVVAWVEADAFCHSMVRSLVGALVPVGEGRRPADWPAEVLLGARRDPAVHVLGPHGLTLEHVRYPDDDEHAARVEVTRRPRTPVRRIR
jgi:tRNA pseudouridine38-40 synthase